MGTDIITQYEVKTDTFAVAWLDMGRTNDNAMPVSFHWVDTGADIPASWPGEPACEYLDDRPCRCDAGYRMGDEVNDLLATGGADAVIAYLTERHQEFS